MTDGATIIRFAQLEPSWAVKQAREPGFLRWLVSWMGGPAGTVNFNLEHAAASRNAAVGFMAMPSGNRQAGLHVHSVAEIYVILKGEIEGFDHTGVPHRAGPLDCVYIPAGVPHGVRTAGTDDLHLIWVHDAIERLGVSVYLQDEPTGIFASRVTVIPAAGLWRGEEAGRVRRAAYVGDGAGGIADPKLRLGVTRLSSGAVETVEPAGSARLFVDTAGETTVRAGDGRRHSLSPLDAVHVPAGAGVTFWNNRDRPADLLWVVEGAGDGGPE